MTNEAPRDDIKRLWREQETEGTTVSPEEIRMKANKLYRRIRYRNLREYIGAGIVVPAFAFFAWKAPSWVGRTGSALMIVAALFVVWQLHRRGAVRAPLQSDSAMDLLDFYLGELRRQRDALKSVWRWYLAPFIPGMVTLSVGFYFQDHATGRTIESHHQFIVLCSVSMALLFVIVWLLNAVAAARLQRQIDAIEKVRSE